MKEYLNWGCEFIDEQSRKTPEKYIGDAYWLPIEIILSTSKRPVEENRINARTISILEVGLKEPGRIYIGHNACYLEDGNHRVRSCARLGWTHFPVTIEIVDRVIKNGTPVNKIVSELLKREQNVKFK